MYQISRHFALLWSYQRISRNPRHMYLFRNKASFYGEELLPPRPHPKLGTTPCRLCATTYSYIRNYLPYLRQYLHPQPEDAPCRADRDRLITESTTIYRTYTTHQASQYDTISAHLTSPSFKTISLSLRILFNPKLKSSNQKAVAPPHPPPSLSSYLTNLTSNVCPTAPTS